MTACVSKVVCRRFSSNQVVSSATFSTGCATLAPVGDGSLCRFEIVRGLGDVHVRSVLKKVCPIDGTSASLPPCEVFSSKRFLKPGVYVLPKTGGIASRLRQERGCLSKGVRSLPHFPDFAAVNDLSVRLPIRGEEGSIGTPPENLIREDAFMAWPRNRFDLPAVAHLQKTQRKAD